MQTVCNGCFFVWLKKIFHTKFNHLNNNIEQRKAQIIAFIASLQNESTIRSFEDVVKYFEKKIAEAETDNIVSEPQVEYNVRPKNKTVKIDEFLLNKKPIRKTIDIETLKREQGWKKQDKTKWDALVKELDIQEPIESLISQLTK